MRECLELCVNAIALNYLITLCQISIWTVFFNVLTICYVSITDVVTYGNAFIAADSIYFIALLRGKFSIIS